MLSVFKLVLAPSDLLACGFFIMRMPHMSSNIPQSIFYSALVGEFLSRMSTQGAKASVSRKMILKIMSKHPEDFVQFKIDPNEILKSLTGA